MESICGANCDECKRCKGCKNTNGCPFGKKCFIAEYIQIGGKDNFNKLKKELIKEINSLGIVKIDELYHLNGEFVNLEYVLPNNKKVKFLDDRDIYLGNQVECEFNDEEVKKCYGIVCNMNFILISEYEENGLNPEIIVYKRR